MGRYHERRQFRVRLAWGAFMAALICLVLAVLLVDGWSIAQRLLAVAGILAMAALAASAAASAS